ncbi:MAG: hypothetical protein KFF73_01730 [Cyclobacteriaceae bacterium]|nr:hypothetical protein [Cyclobacteriaceae bacterium]
MKIEVSNGEVVDKLTILEIKLDRIKDEEKLNNIRKEYVILSKAVSKIINKEDPLYQQLLKINQFLWDVEDRIRKLEKQKDFGEKFIELARSVYIHNDERAKTKMVINKKTNSNLIEEKSYEDY